MWNSNTEISVNSSKIVVDDKKNTKTKEKVTFGHEIYDIMYNNLI